MKIDVDIEARHTGQLVVTITSPDDTVVALHNGSRGVFSEDLVVTYSEYGREHEAPFECGCIMQVDPEYTLADLFGESSEGEWILDVSLSSGFASATLREWCLRFYEDEPTLPFGLKTRREPKPGAPDRPTRRPPRPKKRRPPPRSGPS